MSKDSIQKDWMDEDWKRELFASISSRQSYETYDDDEEELEVEEEDDDYDYDGGGGGNYDEKSGGLACPFCFEDSDVLGFYCHIDLVHHKEAKAAICPICVKEVEASMFVHLISQHEPILKILSKKKLLNGGSRSALSFLKKELPVERLFAPSKGSSAVNASATVESDHLLSPFFYNPWCSSKPHDVASSSSESNLIRNSLLEYNSERDNDMPASADKNEEKARRCEFISGLMCSMILHDDF